MSDTAGMVMVGTCTLAGWIGGSLLVLKARGGRAHGGVSSAESGTAHERASAALEFVQAFTEFESVAALGTTARASYENDRGQQQLAAVYKQFARAGVVLRLSCTHETFQAVDEAAALVEQVVQALSARIPRSAEPQIGDLAAALGAARPGLVAALRAEVAGG